MTVIELEPETQAVPPGNWPGRSAPVAAPPLCPARYKATHMHIYCALEDEHNADQPKEQRLHRSKRGFTWRGFDNPGRDEKRSNL